jgi:hypothetical protein
LPWVGTNEMTSSSSLKRIRKTFEIPKNKTPKFFLKIRKAFKIPKNKVENL